MFAWRKTSQLAWGKNSNPSLSFPQVSALLTELESYGLMSLELFLHSGTERKLTWSLIIPYCRKWQTLFNIPTQRGALKCMWEWPNTISFCKTALSSLFKRKQKLSVNKYTSSPIKFCESWSNLTNPSRSWKAINSASGNECLLYITPVHVSR